MLWIWKSVILLLLLPPGLLQAQIREHPAVAEPEIFGEITDSLFTLETDTAYPYEYLLRQIQIGFHESRGQIRALLEHHYRIRVLTDDPVLQAEAALVTIPFHHADNIEQVEVVDAVTYHPEGRRFFMDKERIQRAELNSRYSTLEFLLPNVQMGSILEVKYVLSRSYIEELPDIYLAQRVPTRNFHLILHNEPYLRDRVVEPAEAFPLHYHEELIDTSAVPRVFTYRRPEPLSVEHWYGSLPAVENSVYSPPLTDLRGTVRLQISEFGIPRQPLENSWEFVVAQIRRGELNPWQRLEELKEIRTLGAELAADADDDREILELLFQYLNRRVMFNGEYQPFPMSPLSKVLDEEPSDQAAINLVLMAMLDGAGLEVWPVLLSGRDRGEIDREFPSIHQFSQMLLLSRIEGEEIWLDGSFSFSHPNLIRTDSFHDQGLLLKRDSFEWRMVEPEGSRFDLEIRLEGELSENGDLFGEIEIVGDGYPAHEMWQMLGRQSTADELFRELFFDSYESIQFTRATVEQLEEAGYPLRLEGQFRIPGYALSFQNGLQFHPMIVGYMEKNPLPDEERNVPILLDAPEHLLLEYRLRLPEGFRLREQNQGGRTGLDGAELAEEYHVSGRELIYRFRVDIDRRAFQPAEYEALRKLYERWVLLSNHEWFISRENEQ